jgi:FkbM family methyltransferase
MGDGRIKAVLRGLLPRAVRPQRILWGPLRGFRIVTSWHDYPGAIFGRTEQALLGWFAEHICPGETWLDVGAHYGYTAIALCRLVGSRGRVFAFEPEIRTAGHLAHTRDLNQLAQLTVVPFGLGRPDSIEMKRLPVVRGMIDRTASADGNSLSELVVTRLDWLWNHICGDQPRIDGIKIDVQGMEIETLEGMSTLLREFKPHLILEVHRGVDRRELLDLMGSVGYAQRGEPVAPELGESDPLYLDDRSYYFATQTRRGSEAL